MRGEVAMGAVVAGEAGIVIFGLACVVAALIGGGLKAVGIEFPLLSSGRVRALLALLGMVIAGYGAVAMKQANTTATNTPGATIYNQKSSGPNSPNVAGSPTGSITINDGGSSQGKSKPDGAPK